MTISQLNKRWRPYTAIGLGINIVLLPPTYVWLDSVSLLHTETLQFWIYIYGTMCTLFASLAGIRQFDKNKERDVLRDLGVANYGFNPTSHNSEPLSEHQRDIIQATRPAYRAPAEYGPPPVRDPYFD